MMFAQSMKYLAVVLITIVVVIYPFGKFFYVPALKTAIELKVRAEIEQEQQAAEIIVDSAVAAKHKETEVKLTIISKKYADAQDKIKALMSTPPKVNTVYVTSECAVERETVEQATDILCESGLIEEEKCSKR